MGSEVAISQLMRGLDTAVREIGDMETKLEVYDQLLSGVRVTMASLGSQYASILMENKNLKSLFREVDELVVSYYFSLCLITSLYLITIFTLCRLSWTLIHEWSILY